MKHKGQGDSMGTEALLGRGLWGGQGHSKSRHQTLSQSSAHWRGRTPSSEA